MLGLFILLAWAIQIDSNNVVVATGTQTYQPVAGCSTVDVDRVTCAACLIGQTWNGSECVGVPTKPANPIYAPWWWMRSLAYRYEVAWPCSSTALLMGINAAADAGADKEGCSRDRSFVTATWPTLAGVDLTVEPQP